jgi:PAS domain S-box-containing protein
VIISDVEATEFVSGTRDLEEYRRSGIRAVQSTPLISRGGRLLGMISTHWSVPYEPSDSDLRRLDLLARQAADLIEHAQAEEMLRDSEERLRLATEAADVGFWDVDPVNDTLFWPPVVKAMFGMSADVPVTLADFYAGLHPEDRERIGTQFAAAIDPKTRAIYDVEYRTVGKEDRVVRWVAAKGRGVFDANGTCIRVIGTAIDITARKRVEEHRALLINELNHRVKNTLATVQSLAGQTLRNATSTDEARDVLESRLLALAKAHDVLTREHWVGADLREVVKDAVAAYEGGGATPRIRVAGCGIRLRPRSALALSMALHELATNAVKYGALSNAEGAVSIDWQVSAGEGFGLCWTESGGPPVEQPRRRGFGSRLVEFGLAQDLAGEVALRFERAGLVCNIEAPIEEIRARNENDR